MIIIVLQSMTDFVMFDFIDLKKKVIFIIGYRLLMNFDV